jgi:hypothetical protein
MGKYLDNFKQRVSERRAALSAEKDAVSNSSMERHHARSYAANYALSHGVDLKDSEGKPRELSDGEVDYYLGNAIREGHIDTLKYFSGNSDSILDEVSTGALEGKFLGTRPTIIGKKEHDKIAREHAKYVDTSGELDRIKKDEKYSLAEGLGVIRPYVEKDVRLSLEGKGHDTETVLEAVLTILATSERAFVKTLREFSLKSQKKLESVLDTASKRAGYVRENLKAYAGLGDQEKLEIIDLVESLT